MYPTTARLPFQFNPMWIAFIGSLATALLLVNLANGQIDGIDGFTEPFQKVDLASDESGAIDQLNFDAGMKVKKGDVVAKLDPRAQELQLEIATHLASTQSQMVAAERSYEKRTSILERLRQLKSKGHASESEIIRAEMELAIAEAKLLSVKEEQVVREIEKRRAEVQLDRRFIRAPFDGVIAEVHRREGEFLSPLHPEIVSIVKVDRLLAKFAVPSSQSSMFKVGSEFEIQMGNGKTVTGKVYQVGVEIDAQSSTVEIKLVVENSDFSIKSGASCTLKI
ncbi:MAG: efflux RND transporter periplasmic adaptor subunit [Planctomycetota bacterium]